mgnify:CR=1 FL=1
MVAKWLLSHGAYSVRIVENLSYGTISVEYCNQCWNDRRVNSMNDFDDAKAELGGRGR